jgi:pyridoxal phosphate phosphatase PHOSPHO2
MPSSYPKSYHFQGLIINRIQDSLSCKENKRFIYLGDGSGDYCPSLRLKEKDFVMPRKNFPVWDLICKDPSLVKAKIYEWSDGEEQERVLHQLINKISMEENVQCISTEFKKQIPSFKPHEALPKALSVQI